MAELGKIEKPEVKSFKSKRKLYVVPTLPFEELALQFNIDNAKIERFWGEVNEKIEYFASTYGNIGIMYVEGISEDESAGLEFFEKYGKDSSHYKLAKTLIEKGAKIKGIDKEELIGRSRLLFDEYSKSFLPEIKKLYEEFFGKNIDFEGWRNYLVKKIQETQDEMSRLASKLIGEMPDDASGVLIITDERPVEYPQDTDVFMIRPPSFDELARNIRDSSRAMS
ncbi:Uncharacterised protein [uncultured archaeon]|nr:Uncharacterised protein [uncultured archaeon]